MLYLTLLAVVTLVASTGAAGATTFESWLNGFKSRAYQQGISNQTMIEAFRNIKPSRKVIELDGKQPEKKIGFDEYVRRTITRDRISSGQALLRQHWTTLHRIERQYGVPAEYVVALWGIETSYGKNTGGFDLIQALSTLAWEGRRGTYFESELLKALKILQGGHVKRSDFKGSWAGAMGQIQFMPSSWLTYAVDDNGDGHKDIWTTRSDVFASAANYLARSGWIPGQGWGRQVRLSQNLNKAYINSNARMSLAEWQRAGVTGVDGRPLAGQPGVRSSLIRPDGAGGKVYLVDHNFQTVMTWNRSKYFALSVGMLADQLALARPDRSLSTSSATLTAPER